MWIVLAVRRDGDGIGLIAIDDVVFCARNGDGLGLIPVIGCEDDIATIDGCFARRVGLAFDGDVAFGFVIEFDADDSRLRAVFGREWFIGRGVGFRIRDGSADFDFAFVSAFARRWLADAPIVACDVEAWIGLA